MRRVLASCLLGIIVAACGAGGGTGSPAASGASPWPPGTYTSTKFQPAVTFTLPTGWEVAADAAAYFQLRPAASEVAGIHLFRDPVAASQAADCPAAAQPNVGSTSTELIAWLRSLPGLVVGNPALVTVGGLRGASVDIGIAEGWTTSCPFASGSPTVPLIVGKDGGYHWIIVGNERLRFYLLDLPGGGTLIVDIDAFDGTLIGDLLGNASPIVSSFTFAAS